MDITVALEEMALCCDDVPFGLIRLRLSADDLRELSRLRLGLLNLRDVDGPVISIS